MKKDNSQLMPGLGSSLIRERGQAQKIQSTYKKAKLIDEIKQGRCVMEGAAINFEMAAVVGGKVSSLNNFSGTGKEEGDGKADNYRVRRMFSFRIQKMLGDLDEKRWL